MRLYSLYAHHKLLADFLVEKDIPCFVIDEAARATDLASHEKTFGCVICPIYGLNDIDWLLSAWNKHAKNLVQVGIVDVNNLKFLVACPSWAKDCEVVRELLVKLSE